MPRLPRRFVIDSPPIEIGYAWACRITAETPDGTGLFPEGVELIAHVRETVESETILATLSTGNDKIVRASDSQIDITIPPEDTVEMVAGTVVLDLVRTDLDPPSPLRVKLTIPTVLTVTRGLE